MLAASTLQISALLLGFVVIASVLFLYEDEDKRIQNLLEDAWIRVSDARRAAMSAQNAFLIAVLEISEKALTRTFGTPLISSRSIAMPTDPTSRNCL